MVEKTVIVNLNAGLHARPAASFVQLASTYPCEILIRKGDKEVNAKSILGIMSLAVTKGTEVTLRCNGDNEQEAADKLADLLSREE